MDEKAVVQQVRDKYKTKRLDASDDRTPLEAPEIAEAPSAPSVTWREQLMSALQAMSPDAFERLAQRILRESGFVEVKVTGRSGDGGIDGLGLLRLQGIVSFHVLFQCKRWKGTVGSREIRDFRGAMVGRTDKGLFITTGTFSLEAQREATRDGAPPIDLIDGDRLLDLMKSLRLGVQTEMVEKVTVDASWIQSI